MTEKFEREIASLFDQEPVSESFVSALRTKLNASIDLKAKERKPFYLRPVWIGLTLLIIGMFISTLVIGPKIVYAELRRLMGYIPGMGLVDSSAPIRVLAEPVEQTRDGVTVSVVRATLTADRTHVEYRIFGVQLSAYPDREDISGCMTQEYLLLPDGTKLERMNDYPALPRNVNEAVLVIPCIGNTLPGMAPENWQIPLRFITAPPDFTVMPVQEMTPAAATVESVGRTTPEPVDSTVIVEKVIETEKGYILIGSFNPATTAGDWVQTTGMPVIVDATGKNIAYSMPMNVELGGNNINNGGYTWAYEFNAAGVAFPLTITFKGVILTQADPEANAVVIFDAGEAPQFGQEWILDKQFELAGHSITLKSVSSDSRGGYSFNFQVDPRVYSVGISIEGHTSNGGGGGGGGGLTDGKFSVSLAFAQLPAGKLNLIVSQLTEIGDPITWLGSWSPTTPRTDLPSSQELPAGVCATANTIETLAALPGTYSGKALVYEPMPGSDQWGLSLYDLDGANRTVVAQSGNWGELSPDGKKVAYSAPGSLQIFDIASGVGIPMQNVDGYDLHWSNDGSMIAYIGGTAAGVNVVDLGTSKSVQVSAMGYESVIGWSADDTQLIIAVPFTGGSAWQIRSVNLSTGKVLDLFIIENGSYKALNATLSPDGQWIAYRGRENSSVYLVKTDGSETRLLLDNPSVATSGLAWSQNGWLGVSLMQNDTSEQKLLLVDPVTCQVYLAPAVTGSLEGLLVR